MSSPCCGTGGELESVMLTVMVAAVLPSATIGVGVWVKARIFPPPVPEPVPINVRTTGVVAETPLAGVATILVGRPLPTEVTFALFLLAVVAGAVAAGLAAGKAAVS